MLNKAEAIERMKQGEVLRHVVGFSTEGWYIGKWERVNGNAGKAIRKMAEVKQLDYNMARGEATYAWQSEESQQQAAADSAGEAEYSEVMAEVAEYTVKTEPFRDSTISFVKAPDNRSITVGIKTENALALKDILNSETAQLRAENEDMQKQLDEVNAWRDNDRLYAQTLEKENEALKAENARMKASAKGLLHLIGAMDISEDHVLKHIKNRLEEVIHPAQAASEAPKQASEVTLTKPEPKFKVGDKVRITEVTYKDGEFDTVVGINKAGDVAELSYHDEGQDFWAFDELVHYQAPKPKKAIPTRCRVNWSKLGFSSGSYEVVGYSQEKQIYMLNISTDDTRAMIKPVRFADCLGV